MPTASPSDEEIPKPFCLGGNHQKSMSTYWVECKEDQILCDGQ